MSFVQSAEWLFHNNTSWCQVCSVVWMRGVRDYEDVMQIVWVYGWKEREKETWNPGQYQSLPWQAKWCSIGTGHIHYILATSFQTQSYRKTNGTGRGLANQVGRFVVNDAYKRRCDCTDRNHVSHRTIKVKDTTRVWKKCVTRPRPWTKRHAAGNMSSIYEDELTDGCCNISRTNPTIDSNERNVILVTHDRTTTILRRRVGFRNFWRWLTSSHHRGGDVHRHFPKSRICDLSTRRLTCVEVSSYQGDDCGVMRKIWCSRKWELECPRCLVEWLMGCRFFSCFACCVRTTANCPSPLSRSKEPLPNKQTIESSCEELARSTLHYP